MKEPNTIDTQRRQLTHQLAAISESAALDAQVLIAHALEKPRSWILSHPETVLQPDQVEWLKAAAQKMIQGDPLPYVLGRWEFFNLPFIVSPSVLIPRPETELLVEQALEWCQDRIKLGIKSLSIADVGTGSGCIASSLLKNLPSNSIELQLTAIDISYPALQVAKQNAALHKISHLINFLQTDLLSSFRESSLDLICTNLPYIPSEVLRTLRVAQSEPKIALDGGETGTQYIKLLLGQASHCLKPNGLLLAEIESSLGELVLNDARTLFSDAQVDLIQDYSQHDRILRISLVSGFKRPNS